MYKPTWYIARLIIPLIGLCFSGWREPSSAQPMGRVTAKMTSDSAIGLRIGGAGGVYFLATPGELLVEIEKRDRHLFDRQTELRAILVGPDRRVVNEATIPDDGERRGSGLGKPQRVRLVTHVERDGVYALNVTISQDRYGEEIEWGFRTNCPRYLVETSRGHRDQRREEPIVLFNDEQPGDICFLPRQGEFEIAITDIAAGVEALTLHDAEGSLIQTLTVDSEGNASCRIPANEHRHAIPWRLHFPKHKGIVQIDGVTRWDQGDAFTNLPLWTPDLDSWFPFAEYRWLLTPYRRQVYGDPGSRGRIAFYVHNNAESFRTVQLRLEFPDRPWPAQLSTSQIELGRKQRAEVSIEYTVPPLEQTSTCHLRATVAENPEFTTYSTLIVNAGEPPFARPLVMPLTLRPYEHENEQLGYLPEYPVESEPYFDLANHAVVRTSNGIATLRDGSWDMIDLRTAVQSRTPPFETESFGLLSSKVAFDADGDMYILATGGGHAVLLHSVDEGKTFGAYVIPQREGRPRGSFDIEQFTGHNTPAGPPPILRYTQTATDPKLIWRHINDLELFLPEKRDGRLLIGEPILISDQCIGLSAHSGIPASVVSQGTKVHVAWGEATDPALKVPGVPTYVVTYDRNTKTLGERALVGYGPPANDIHNSPSITIDRQGYLHVVIGTHGQPFPYAQSLKPNDAAGGWTESVLVGEGLSLTYVGLVCDPTDTLHLVARLWRSGVDPFPLSSHATLAHLRKRPGQPWEAPRPLVVAPFSEYSIFYHRLTIDHRGRLFVSYDYWSTYWFYRIDHYGDRRALMMSPDGGETWKLVAAADLA
ncbi:MAG: BNR-4 repeat-containing protein [Candidatus Zipacnadales bacterium]